MKNTSAVQRRAAQGKGKSRLLRLALTCLLAGMGGNALAAWTPTTAGGSAGAIGNYSAGWYEDGASGYTLTPENATTANLKVSTMLAGPGLTGIDRIVANANTGVITATGMGVAGTGSSFIWAKGASSAAAVPTTTNSAGTTVVSSSFTSYVYSPLTVNTSTPARISGLQYEAAFIASSQTYTQASTAKMMEAIYDPTGVICSTPGQACTLPIMNSVGVYATATPGTYSNVGMLNTPALFAGVNYELRFYVYGAGTTGTANGNVMFDNPEVYSQVGTESISLTKVANPTTYTQIGDSISYTYTIKNTGDAPLLGTALGSITAAAITQESKIPLGKITCTPPPNGVLLPQGTMTCTAPYAITLADLQAGKVVNTATATAYDAGGRTALTATANATVNGPTALLDKTWVNGKSGDTVTLAISGSSTGNNVGGSNTVGGSSNTLATAKGGGTVTLTETFTTGNIANYNAPTVACTNLSTSATVTTSAVTVNGSSATANYTQPATGVTSCVFTNTRKSATLQLGKSWTNSKSGDVASIGATTSNGLSSNTAAFTATAPTAANSGSAVTVYAGDTLTLPAETMTTGSLSNYTTGLSCTVAGTPASSTPSTTNGQNSNTLLISGTDATKAIVCTYANSGLPDLTITKTHSGTWRQGDTGKTYTLTATNSGAGSTSGTVSVTDTLPTGLSATAISGTGWTCVLSTLTCTRSDTLAAGSSYPAITVTVNVAANAPASVTNTASVSGGGQTNTANDTASDPTTISPPLPTVSKSYSPTSIPADSTTTSTLTIMLGNAGSAAQTLSSALTDNVGAGLVITSVTGGTCTASSTSFSGTTVTYASGASIPAGGCTILVTVKSGTSGSYPNTIPAGALSTNAGSNAAASNTATLTVTPAADLSITKTGPASAVSGNQITYLLTLGNAGPNAANGATFTDSVPGNLTGLSAICVNASGGVGNCTASVSGSTVTGSVGTFPSGGSVQIQVTGTVPAGATGSLSNQASVTAPGGVTEINTANNTSATVTTTLSQNVNLTVSKTDGQSNVIKGQQVTYTIVVSNGGPSNTTASFADTTFNGVSLSNWTCTAASGGATCPTGLPASGGYSGSLGLPAGSSVTFQVTGTVTATSGSISNTATVSPPGGVTNTAPASSTSTTDTDTVIAAPVAQNDTASTPAGTPVNKAVLSNDSGSGLVPSSVVFVNPPSGSTLSSDSKTLTVPGQGSYTVQTDGSVTFTPATNYAGTATPVTYRVTDSYGQTATATLTETVTATPPVPADVLNPALSNTAAATTISGLSASDSNAGGSIVSYIIATLPSAASGVLYYADGSTPVKSGDVLTPAQAASLKFDPAAGFVGSATFDYTATDNYGLTSTTNKNSDATVTAGAATFTIPVQAPQLPSLSVTKTVDSKYLRVTPNPAKDTSLTISPTQLTYTLTVQNTGNAAATNVQVTDTLPAGLTYASASGTPALVGTNPAVAGQKLTFTVASLSAGNTQTITVVTNAALAANTNQTQLSNTVTALADGISAVTSAPALTDVIYPKLQKTGQNITRGTAASLSSADGVPGDVLEYCLAYNNYGSVALPSYSITDQVPGNTKANVDAYGAGKGIQLTRKTTATTTTNQLTSAADADGGTLTGTGGGAFGEGTLNVDLGDVAAGESGSACFRVAIR